LLVFAIWTLVQLEIEPLPEAIATALLLLGSTLAMVLAQMRTAQRLELGWHKVTLFSVGGVVQRSQRSHPDQEARIALSGLAVNVTLALLFGALWYLIPQSPLGLEMEIVALFNVALFVFSFFLRLSPKHDNLLHAALTYVARPPYPNRVMRLLHTIALMTFVMSFIVAVEWSWMAFGWWFAFALMFSQLTTVAERSGEYTVTVAPEPRVTPAASVRSMSAESAESAYAESS
jgi:hypothetical protein